MGKCIKCGTETGTQYECYSISRGDYKTEKESQASYAHHKDYFCNKCVVGPEKVYSFFFSLITLVLVAIGIYLLAIDHISADIYLVFLLLLVFLLAVFVCNLLWLANVIKALATGEQRQTKWYFGMFFLMSLNFVSSDSGEEAYMKYMSTANGNKKYVASNIYGTLKRSEINTPLNTPASLRIIRPSSSIGANIVVDVFLNDVQIGSLSNGQSMDISVAMKYNHLKIGGSTYEFDAFENGRGEMRLKANFSLGIAYPKIIPNFKKELR